MSTDAVTFSFGDRAAERYGFVRLGVADGVGSVLAVLFAGKAPVAALVQGQVPTAGSPDWGDAELAGLHTATVPGGWTITGAVEDWQLELSFEAIGDPADLAEASPVARRGGMAASEQLCRVSGIVRGGGRETAIDCAGQRSHQWGSPDWERIELARSLTAWVEGPRGVTLTAVRPAGARSHGDEEIWAAIIHPDRIEPVVDPRLSTTYDGDGRQRHAGIELWAGTDDELAHRGAGEVLCGSTLDLGRLRLDTAFFAWHVDGREGVGRYDLLRRA